MKSSFTLKNIIIVTSVVATVVVVFLVHALAGLSARPVVFVDPPAFVERYAAAMDHSDPSSLPRESEIDGEHVDESEAAKLTADFSNEEALVFKVIMDGESPDLLLRLFTHPEKAQRVKIASALAAVNAKFTHDEESGFAGKREKFWVDVKEHLLDMQNAIFEALIRSAEEGAQNYIWYTMAWMPGQDHAKTVEMFVWAAKHHPHWRVRQFSVYFVVVFGLNEELAGPLLDNRTHDSDYRVRKKVLDLRFNRFIE